MLQSSPVHVHLIATRPRQHRQTARQNPVDNHSPLSSDRHTAVTL